MYSICSYYFLKLNNEIIKVVYNSIIINLCDN